VNQLLQLRLQRFVNREAEMRSFCAALDQEDPGQPVIVVWGDGGSYSTSACSSQPWLTREVA
jgi:hypothetical protein